MVHAVLVPRDAGSIARPAVYVDGPFLTGELRPGAPAGVREIQAVARGVRAALDADGRPVTRVAADAGIDRRTIYDLLAGRAWIDLITLARLEGALRTRLWPGQTPEPQ